jgi:hypothetical protein
MEKAATFSEITRRNALRKANSLPLMDVHAEYTHQVAIAAQRDFRAIYDQHAGEHAAEREDIRQQVLAEYQAQHGLERAQTKAGPWEIDGLAQRRFAAFIADKYGVAPPVGSPGRHPVAYGGAPKDGDQDRHL